MRAGEFRAVPWRHELRCDRRCDQQAMDSGITVQRVMAPVCNHTGERIDRRSRGLNGYHAVTSLRAETRKPAREVPPFSWPPLERRVRGPRFTDLPVPQIHAGARIRPPRHRAATACPALDRAVSNAAPTRTARPAPAPPTTAVARRPCTRNREQASTNAAAAMGHRGFTATRLRPHRRQALASVTRRSSGSASTCARPVIAHPELAGSICRALAGRIRCVA